MKTFKTLMAWSLEVAWLRGCRPGLDAPGPPQTSIVEQGRAARGRITVPKRAISRRPRAVHPQWYIRYPASTIEIARTWFVSDLDGTLLGPDATLSAYSRHALRSLIADGLLFTVATARAAPSIRALLGDLALPLPVIELNGTFVSDLATGRHLIVHALSPDIASAVMARIRRRGLSAFIATSRDDEDRLYHAGLPNPAMVWYRDEKIALGDPRLRAIDDLQAALSEQVVGFTLLAERDAMIALAAEIRADLADLVQVHLFENPYWPGWWELSIQDRHATKSGAIARLRGALGLESRRLVVFGDGANDVDMFLLADHAVAVENAVPELVAVASEIAARNDQDGVVRWIARSDHV